MLCLQELLALEERIGNVCTGLGEEAILSHLKQRSYICVKSEEPIDAEPCCICQVLNLKYSTTATCQRSNKIWFIHILGVFSFRRSYGFPIICRKNIMMERILVPWSVAMIFIVTALNNGSNTRIYAPFAKQRG